ncbi:MAG: pilus assembly PilX N-terminal domain-containing protein [Desulfuromonadales bacterium]|nr:pilus assembly PilX N-terminal domain-containing protein [Desulfuromonadales bacterium]
MHGERITLQPSKPVNEQGFILIVTMLVLVVLTILCIGALDNSTFEVQIAANDRSSRVAFNLADGGAYAVGTLISETIMNAEVPDYSLKGLHFATLPDPDDNVVPRYSPDLAIGATGVDTITNAWVDSSNNVFLSRLLGTEPPRTDGKFDLLIRSPNEMGDVFVRIAEQEITYGKGGGGAEFGAGSAGEGASAATYLGVDLDVDAYAVRNSSSKIAVSYLFKN